MNTSEHAARIGRLLRRVAAQVPLELYIATGGLVVLAFAPQAHASPVLSAAANVVATASGPGVSINVVTGQYGNNIAGADLNPWGNGSLSWAGSNLVFAGGKVITLGIGDLVDSTDVFSATASLPGTTIGTAAGQWALNSTNYFGFRFLDEVDGQTHYGWGSMIIGASINTRTIGQLAYESVAGAGITVGALPTPAADIPEPSTTALVLASGISGVLVARRRRQLAQ